MMQYWSREADFDLKKDDNSSNTPTGSPRRKPLNMHTAFLYVALKWLYGPFVVKVSEIVTRN